MDQNFNPFTNPRDFFEAGRTFNHHFQQEEQKKLLEEQVRLQKEALEQQRLAQEQARLKQEQQQKQEVDGKEQLERLKEEQKRQLDQRLREEQQRQQRQWKEEQDRADQHLEVLERMEQEYREQRFEAMVCETDPDRKLAMFRLYEEKYKDARVKYDEIIKWKIPLPKEELEQRRLEMERQQRKLQEEKRKRQEEERKRQEEERRRQEYAAMRQQEDRRQQQQEEKRQQQQDLLLSGRIPEFGLRLKVVKQQIEQLRSYGPFSAYLPLLEQCIKFKNYMKIWRSNGTYSIRVNQCGWYGKSPADEFEAELRLFEDKVLELLREFERKREIAMQNRSWWQKLFGIEP